MAAADRMSSKRYAVLLGFNHLTIASKDSNVLIALLGVRSPEDEITWLCTGKGNLLSTAVIVLGASVMVQGDLLDLVDGVLGETTAVKAHNMSVVISAW